MADISMCSGDGCAIKHTCYRFTAYPNEWRQTYFTEVPKPSGKDCKYYWEIEKASKTKKNGRKET